MDKIYKIFISHIRPTDEDLKKVFDKVINICIIVQWWFLFD